MFQPNIQQKEEGIEIEKSNEERRIKLVSPREVENEIKYNINPKKARGYDLITGQILKKMPRKDFVKLTNLINPLD